MTSNNPGGVRNLRAMFEVNNASPEPRGRSRAPSGNDEARPTSKVRASFVSVEPSGLASRDLGATKGTADGVNSTGAHRRESFSIGQDQAEMIHELKKTIGQEKEDREQMAALVEPVPEHVVEEREASRPPPPMRQATQDPVSSFATITTEALKNGEASKPNAASKEAPKAGSDTQNELGAHIQSKVAELPTVSAQEELKTTPVSAEAPGDNPDKVVSGVQDTDAVMRPSDPKDQAAVSGGEALPPPTEVLPPSTSRGMASHAPVKTDGTAKAVSPSVPSKAKPNGASARLATSGKVKTSPKPPAISTSKAPTAPAPKSAGAVKMPKTPTTPRVPVTSPSAKSSVAKSPAPKTPVSKPKETKGDKPSKPVAAKAKPATKSSTASAADAPPKAKASAREAAKSNAKPAAPAKDATQTSPFRKPRPKSPTRPVRLPTHLTAPTASSAAKHDGNAPPTTVRSLSRLSRAHPAPPKVTSTVRKQTSRASLPAPSAIKRPDSRQSAKASDEGFLARMMRPTQSSAGKTHEKMALPPRRAASVKPPAKPKLGKENLAAKGNSKVEEDVETTHDTATTNGADSHEQETVEHAEDSAVVHEQPMEVSPIDHESLAEEPETGAVMTSVEPQEPD